jgi:hypothetical protein
LGIALPALMEWLKIPGVDNMRSGDAALRLSIVFSMAGFLALAASLYEIDRREKSTSETIAANLAQIERQVQILSNQVRILSSQNASQLTASERQIHALSTQIQGLESRLKGLEDHSRIRR